MGRDEAAAIQLEVNGFRFDGLRMGPEDGPLVLFLHGFPEFASSWLEVMGPVAARGFRAVAMDQRGYSAGARPASVEEYGGRHLVADAVGFADALGAKRFHLVGHDWGGAVAWRVAALYPERLLSLTVLATPHPDAFFAAITSDADQRARSAYFALFRAPDGAAEKLLLDDDAGVLRTVYQGKVPAQAVEEYVRRFREEGALTAALNWYRAMRSEGATGAVQVPTLYVWGEEDMALGETAALATKDYVRADYRFVRMAGASHWLMAECAEMVAWLIVEQVEAWGAAGAVQL